jgi:hypothetical protein
VDHRAEAARKPLTALPFFCPLPAATSGKGQQAQTQREGLKSVRSRAIMTFSGNVQHMAAKGG